MRYLCVCFFLFLFLPSISYAKPLIADVSDHNITIDTRFSGKTLLLFGARTEAGDIVVVVRGPKRSFMVREKERVAGIWVNRHHMRFMHMDSFYAVASNRPLAAIGNDYLLTSLGIRKTLPTNAMLTNPDLRTRLEAALYAHQQHIQLYVQDIKLIPLMGQTLFKIFIHFPERIPDGHYTAESYLFADGQLTALHVVPIHVEKVGFDAFIANVAEHYPALYGVIAIVIALGMGWIVGTLFKKV